MLRALQKRIRNYRNTQHRRGMCSCNPSQLIRVCSNSGVVNAVFSCYKHTSRIARFGEYLIIRFASLLPRTLAVKSQARVRLLGIFFHVNRQMSQYDNRLRVKRISRLLTIEAKGKMNKKFDTYVMNTEASLQGLLTEDSFLIFIFFLLAQYACSFFILTGETSLTQITTLTPRQGGP